jgi:hypothetical protein
MDIETLFGWVIMIAVPSLFIWRMRSQLTYLQHGKRRAALWLLIPFFSRARVTLYGIGALLYSLIETAGFTAVCFFALYVGYIVMMPYRLEHIKYALAGIAITAVVVDTAALLLHWFQVGNRGANTLLATAWVSLMTALLVVGAAAIVFSQGRLLELLDPSQVDKVFGGLVVLAGAFVVSLVAVNIQIRST